MPRKINVEEQNELLAAHEEQAEKDAGVTTEYGDWGDYSDSGGATDGTLTVNQHVIGCLEGDDLDDYDIDAITEEFREAVNEHLPEGVTLGGEQFIGPYHDRPEWGNDVLAEAIEAVDFDAIAEKHHR